MTRKLEVEIVGDASSLNRALGTASKSTESFGKKALKAGVAFGGGFFAVQEAAHLAKEAIVSVADATIQMSAIQARLTVSFKNAGLNITKYSKQLDEAEASGRRLGFTDEETLTALGSLVTATKSVKLATKDMSVAQDIARFKGVSLTDATKMLTMAMTGSQRAAKQLGISVQPVTKNFDALGKGATKAEKAHAHFLDKIATGNAVIDAVNAHVKGQADAYSKTLPGAIAIARAWLNNLEVEIGQKLVPVITAAVAWIRTNWPQISAAFRQAWDDIRPTLAALGQLVAAVVGIIRAHWSQISPIVQSVVAVVRANLRIMADILKVVADILQGRWGAAWRAAKDLVVASVMEMKARLMVAVTIIKTLLSGVASALTGPFKVAWSKVAGWVGDAAHAIRSTIEPAFNILLGIIHSIISAVQSLIGWIGKIHAPHFSIPGSSFLPHIPGTATGGIVTSPQVRLVGEAGPEAIIPLSGAGGAGALGPIVVQLVVDGKVLAETAFDPLRNQAQKFSQRTGRPAFG